MVNTKLMFITVFGKPGISPHYTSIADEDVEPWGGGEELFDRVLDRAQRSLVALYKGDFDSGIDGLERRDVVSRVLRVTAGEVDMLRRMSGKS